MGEFAVNEKVTMDGNSTSSAEISGLSLTEPAPEGVRPEPVFSRSVKGQAQRLQREAHVCYFVFRHPRSRWYAKVVAVCVAAYLFSPIQVIPNYIPVIGVLDDLLVVFLGAWLLQRITPAEVLTECRELANAADAQRKEKIRSGAAVVASIAIATIWLLAAIAASALIAAYVYR
jgi:uncharacterized membrane protein YkvA (DUF1232 family)